MMAKPTAAQMLQQCRRELMDNVMTQVTDETTLVALEQIQMVLDHCAHRSETEVADLVAETAEMESFATEAVSHHGAAMPRTAAALAALEAGRTPTLLTSELGVTYDLACEAFSCSIEELMDLRDTERTDQAVSWMASQRHDRELRLMPNWGMAGRG